MAKIRLLVLFFLLMVFFRFSGSAQTPNFGSAANFVFFSGSGAISNTGVSYVTGDIGTTAGAVTGFNKKTLNGSTYIANNVTAQTLQDLLAVYNQLYNTPTTNSTHGAIVGNGETLTAGVYALSAAGSISGALYLDAAGDASKIFIIKINGAFTSSASSAVFLLNGASACNVFWVAEGAIGLAASTNMVGTLIAHGAAYSMGAGCTLQGRAFSTTGAIALNTTTATISTGCTAPIQTCGNNPIITKQPNTAKIFKGPFYTMSVEATGANLSYQWRKDGIDIKGATSPTNTVYCNSSDVSGKYNVVIVGSCSPYIVSVADTLVIPPFNFTLGHTSKYVLFTISGAVSNTGSSQFTGNIGTNGGAISGIDTAKVIGNLHNADSNAIKSVADLQNLYQQLTLVSPTNTTHAAVFGNGETLSAGVYTIGAAASVNGTLTLDAGGDSNKVFIFKIGGAFTTAAGAVVNLINDAKSFNIFWVAEGAVALAANTTMSGTLIANNAAISMGANGSLDGRLFSTYGAVAINSISAVKPEDPSPLIRWTGIVNNDWFTIYNWNFGIIPDDTTNITIPAGLTYYPVLNAGLTSFVRNIVIEKNATLSLNGGTLNIKGNIYNSGKFDASSGTIFLMTDTIQTIAPNTFINNTIQNLVIGNNVSLAGPLNVTGAISFGASNIIFNTGQFLTLKSSALGTASIADLTFGGTLTGNSVTGTVTTELYISPKRAWRLLSGQVCSQEPLTINAAWQEGSTTNNPSPGFGTQITGGTSANGFDAGINTNAAIKIYNSNNNSFTGLPVNPGTNIPLTNHPGYFIFIRGDRSTNLSLGISALVTPTVLRVKGTMNAGPVTQIINVANYTLVGNPYLESVDFHTLTKNNVSDKFYVWDPKLAGTNGVGGYVTFIWNNSINAYDATSFVSEESQYIPLGQAFLVESADGINTGSLTFNETDKTAMGSDNAFKKITRNPKMRIDLLEINADKSTSLIDGVLTNFSDTYNNAVDKNDARKIFNLEENIGIFRDNIDLAIERRRNIETRDTSFLSLYNLKKKSYQLLIKTESLNEQGLTAIVTDNYYAANNNIPVNMDGSTTINFSANEDTASFATNRFSVIFKGTKILPFQFISLNAVQQKGTVLIQWTTANELNTKSFDVQGSADGINFNKWATVNAISNNTGNGIYHWINTDVKEGLWYYRIKATNQKGEIIYSKIISITMDVNKVVKSILVIGNPIQNNKFKLQFNNIEKGVYELFMYTVEGQLTKQFSINYSGENTVENFEIGKYLAAGKYQLVLFNKMLNISTALIKEK